MTVDNVALELQKIVQTLTKMLEDLKRPVEQRTIALEEVRAMLAEQAKKGRTAEIRECLKRHGAEKLSEIDPKEYSAILTEIYER